MPNFQLPRGAKMYDGSTKPEDWLTDYVTTMHIAGGSRRWAKKPERRNFLQANLPMKTKIRMILKNNIMISLFLMLRLEIIIMGRAHV